MRTALPLTFVLVLSVASCTTDAPADDSELPMWSNVTSINGSPPPGVRAPLEDVVVMLDGPDDTGQRVRVTRGQRRAGTRASIHTHPYGGTTCVLEGEVSLLMEGSPIKKAPAGTCYFMPRGRPISAYNAGPADAVLIDHFILPPGVEPTVVVEAQP